MIDDDAVVFERQSKSRLLWLLIGETSGGKDSSAWCLGQGVSVAFCGFAFCGFLDGGGRD